MAIAGGKAVSVTSPITAEVRTRSSRAHLWILALARNRLAMALNEGSPATRGVALAAAPGPFGLLRTSVSRRCGTWGGCGKRPQLRSRVGLRQGDSRCGHRPRTTRPRGHDTRTNIARQIGRA